MSSGSHKFLIRVYFEDTDAGGVVYYARYAAFYERARTEMLRVYGFNHPSLIDRNISFVVKKVAIDYILPAKVDDLLEVHSAIKSISGASISYEQKIVNSQGEIINKADVLVVCVGLLKMKPIAIPGSLVTAIARATPKCEE